MIVNMCLQWAIKVSFPSSCRDWLQSFMWYFLRWDLSTITHSSIPAINSTLLLSGSIYQTVCCDDLLNKLSEWHNKKYCRANLWCSFKVRLASWTFFDCWALYKGERGRASNYSHAGLEQKNCMIGETSQPPGHSVWGLVIPAEVLGSTLMHSDLLKIQPSWWNSQRDTKECIANLLSEQNLPLGSWGRQKQQ